MSGVAILSLTPALAFSSTVKCSESEHRPGRRDEDALQIQMRVNNVCLLTTVYRQGRRSALLHVVTQGPRWPVPSAQVTSLPGPGAHQVA